MSGLRFSDFNCGGAAAINLLRPDRKGIAFPHIDGHSPNFFFPEGQRFATTPVHGVVLVEKIIKGRFIVLSSGGLSHDSLKPVKTG